MYNLKPFRKQALIVVAVGLWLPAVSYGLHVMWSYATTPGQSAEPPRLWPGGEPIERRQGQATLVLFAHPQCGCTRASLGELAILMAHAQGKLEAAVFFYRPTSEDSSWVRTDLWRTAAAIPGVHAFEDRDAQMAKRFGVFTSGEALLYSANGRLLFEGGITAYRGHSGDNAGRTAIATLLHGVVPSASSVPISTPVFGCSLRGV